MEIKAGANINGIHVLKVEGEYAYYTRNVTHTVRRYVDGEVKLDRRTDSRPGMIRLDVLARMA